MKSDFKVCLDACVLVNIRVCDLFLRLAEKPRLFLPIWSSEILDETQRTHLKLDWEEELADYFRSELSKAFPDACTDDYKHILPILTNDEKDKHVLAAAVRSGASLILTFNTKDFPEESLIPWNIQVSTPDEYLLVLYEMEPKQVIQRIAAISGQKDETQIDTLIQLGKSCPNFAAKLIDDLELN